MPGGGDAPRGVPSATRVSPGRGRPGWPGGEGSVLPKAERGPQEGINKTLLVLRGEDRELRPDPQHLRTFPTLPGKRARSSPGVSPGCPLSCVRVPGPPRDVPYPVSGTGMSSGCPCPVSGHRAVPRRVPGAISLSPSPHPHGDPRRSFPIPGCHPAVPAGNGEGPGGRRAGKKYPGKNKNKPGMAGSVSPARPGPSPAPPRCHRARPVSPAQLRSRPRPCPRSPRRALLRTSRGAPGPSASRRECRTRECRTVECRMRECRVRECRVPECRTAECGMAGGARPGAVEPLWDWEFPGIPVPDPSRGRSPGGSRWGRARG
ncbi:collagen alpha-1(III) chain-like [Melozone crissalis]|uniref:collagen alpha-1(III) chain-like n=1 Tax=Melozone crissalis TaxID=40204 RepID=UPI0023DB58B9|nr:collagen alpha-1(III) chain-like [Melozone crissalis]